MRMRWLRSVSLETVIGLIAAMLAIGMTLLSLFGYLLDFEPSEEVVIALLGILVMAATLDQHRDRAFRQKLFSVSTNVKNIDDLLRNFDDLPEFDQRIQGVTEIWISGFTMTGFLLRHERTMKEFLERGGKLKVLLGVPEEKFVRTCLEYFGVYSDQYNYYRDQIKVSLGIVQKWSGLDIEIKYMPTPPPHNLLILDPYQVTGEAQVHLITYGADSDLWPLFLIRNYESQYYFQIYVDEFDKVWKNAAAWNGS